MATREIKFKMWLEHIKVMTGPKTLNELPALTGGVSISDGVTPLQFTGLKDKNGVDIYEGDVCRFDTLQGGGNTGFIKYREGSFRLSNQINPKNDWDGEIRMWNDGSHDWYSIENLESFEIEIIGNIYENPELLSK